MAEMILQEEELILPLLSIVFSEDDWVAVTNESDAFGYTIIQAPEKKWQPTTAHDDESSIKDELDTDQFVFGGGGFLTTEEAKHILNNLPLEITFVDKTAMFRY